MELYQFHYVTNFGQQSERNHWLQDAIYDGAVVVLRQESDKYLHYPPVHPNKPRIEQACDPFTISSGDPSALERYHSKEPFEAAIAALNVEVALRISSNVVQVIMSTMPKNMYDVPLDNDSRVQILDDMASLPRARKHQYAAFLRREKCLIVWSDSASRIIEYAVSLEKKIFDFIWNDADAVGRYERKDIKAEFDWHDIEAAEAPRRKKGILFSIVIAMVRRRPS